MKKNIKKNPQSKNRLGLKEQQKRRTVKQKKELEKQKKSQKIYYYLGQGLFILIVCFCLWFLFRVSPHRVDGQSMEPTLFTNDRLFVIKGDQPKRYSLITFTPENKPKESYVKRVIGLPGDKIWLDNNTLYINQQFSNQKPVPKNNSQLLGEELPDGTIKVFIKREVAQHLSQYQKIPDKQYFVLGDNRNHSTDSRQLGLIDQTKIEGVVRFRYYPFTKWGQID